MDEQPSDEKKTPRVTTEHLKKSIAEWEEKFGGPIPIEYHIKFLEEVPVNRGKMVGLLSVKTAGFTPKRTKKDPTKEPWKGIITYRGPL